MRTVEKLLQPTERTKDSEFGPAYVNPDGPEAAALIEELTGLLQRWSAIDGGSWHVERQAREKDDLLAETRAVLDRIRA
jgi:hypothetical protein